MKTITRLATELDLLYGIHVYETADGEFFLSTPSERWEHFREAGVVTDDYFPTFDDAILFAASGLDLTSN